MKIKITLFLLLFFGPARWLAQEENLKEALQKARHDTIRCRLLNEMIEAEPDDNIWPGYNAQMKSMCENDLKQSGLNDQLRRTYQKYLAAAINNQGFLANNQGNISQALAYYQQALVIDEACGNQEGIASSFNNIGSVYQYQGDIGKALEHYYRSLAIRQQIHDQVGIAESFNNIGLVYNEQGDIPKALAFYQKSLSIEEKNNDRAGMAISFNNIGAIYEQQNDLGRALVYYHKGVKVQEEINNRQALAGTLHNIGAIYTRQNQVPRALEYFRQSFKIAEETGNITGMAYGLNSLGTVYKNKKQLDTALAYWQQSLALWKKINDKQGMALTLNNMAAALFEAGKTSAAIAAGKSSLALAQELGFPASIRDAVETLGGIYAQTGNWKDAYRMQVIFKQMSDSLNNEAGRKAFLQKSFQYEYEKRATADSIRSVEERKVFAAQIKQQKIQRTALYCGIAFITLFALFMYNRFRVTQKQKGIIELKEKETQQQKHIIEEKHKEISDSINYAERIQRSFLATTEMLDRNLKNYFVLFRPKAIVSGDFYWAAILNNGLFAFAVADSTGHGVPGAIMSLLNITSLEKAIEQHSAPADILNHTRSIITSRLKNDGSSEGGKDGMDCSLMVFDFKSLQMEVAAAQNPVWIIRAAEGAGPKEFIELSADKMPVGKHDHEQRSFTGKTFELKKGDMVYAVTDGFADQFGGPKGKKFMYKRLRELLISISDEAPARQHALLAQTLMSWANGLEQVDDITIAGVRIQ